MFRYTKRVWPTVEKKKGRKKITFKISKWTRVPQWGAATRRPPGCSNIQHPHPLPRLSSPTWLQLVLLSTPHAKSAFPNKTIQKYKEKDPPTVGAPAKLPRTLNLQTSKPKTFKPKTFLSKYKRKKNKQKKDSRAAPANHKTPLKHFLIHLRGEWGGGGGVNWAIITFHSSRFNESSHGEHRDALEWSLDYYDSTAWAELKQRSLVHLWSDPGHQRAIISACQICTNPVDIYNASFPSWRVTGRKERRITNRKIDQRLNILHTFLCLLNPRKPKMLWNHKFVLFHIFYAYKRTKCHN